MQRGDAFGLRQILADVHQGDFRLDRNRGAIYFPRTKAFPRNTEVESIVTFASENPGALIQQNAPDAGSLTIRVHRSLSLLPDPGFRPRAFDPRVGSFPLIFRDYSRPYNEDCSSSAPLGVEGLFHTYGFDLSSPKFISFERPRLYRNRSSRVIRISSSVRFRIASGHPQ